MLSAEALRLAAIEVLCPTAAVLSSNGFPTLAQHRVFDSRAPAVSEIDGEDERGYTPVLSIYTLSSQIVQRGDAADATDYECQAVIEIVAELSVAARDDSGDFADALAGSDPEARLVLAAMVSQVRYLLEFSQGGTLFRQNHIAVRRIDEETYAVPNLGLRWQRVTMRVTAAIPDDRFDFAGGMPEPMKTLHAALPAGSYAKAKLAQLAAAFAADPRPALEEVTILGAPDGEPIASTGDLT